MYIFLPYHVSEGFKRYKQLSNKKDFDVAICNQEVAMCNASGHITEALDALSAYNGHAYDPIAHPCSVRALLMLI